MPGIRIPRPPYRMPLDSTREAVKTGRWLGEHRCNRPCPQVFFPANTYGMSMSDHMQSGRGVHASTSQLDVTRIRQ
jgi:hypothetical protein